MSQGSRLNLPSEPSLLPLIRLVTRRHCISCIHHLTPASAFPHQIRHIFWHNLAHITDYTTHPCFSVRIIFCKCFLKSEIIYSALFCLRTVIHYLVRLAYLGNALRAGSLYGGSYISILLGS